MIAPVGGVPPPPPAESRPPQISQATIDMMNYLWAATYHIYNQIHADHDFYNFQLACKAIYAFMQLFKNQAPQDPYTNQIWQELNQPLFGGSSLSQLATNYMNAMNQGNSAAIDQIFSQFESTAATAQMRTVAVNVHDWWGNTHTPSNSYVIKPGNLTAQELNNLENYLKLFEQNPTNLANLKNLIQLISQLGPILNNPQDPFTQELADLLNTPIFPGNPSATIMNMCRLGEQSIPELEAALTQLQGNHNELYNAIVNINNYEFPSSSAQLQR
jgi:hypothetical protein